MHQCIDTTFGQYMRLLKRFQRLVRLCFWAVLTSLGYFVSRCFWNFSKFFSFFNWRVPHWRFYSMDNENVWEKSTIIFRLSINSLCVSAENRATLNFFYWKFDVEKIAFSQWMVGRAVLRRLLRLARTKHCTMTPQSIASTGELLKNKSTRVQSTECTS